MLINLRNALMTGKRLPFDAEVEYLESTGTQWIDTGVLPDFDMIARITLSYQQNSCSPAWGTRGTSYYNRAYTSAYNTSTISTATFYGGQFDNVTAEHITYIKPAVGQIFEFKLLKDGGWLDGVKVNEWNSTPQPFTPYGSIYLFGRNDPANTKSACRIYHFSLELNGVLVRDYIPVRVGTVGYLYDRVSGKLFGNAGTGDFVVGQDVVPVEWLCSSANNINSQGAIPAVWIDTGIALSADIKMSLTASFASIPDRLIGIYGGPSGRFDIGISSGDGTTFVTNIGATTPNTTSDTHVHKFVLDVPNHMGYVDEHGVSTGSTFSVTIPGNIMLFTRGRGDRQPPIDYTAWVSKTVATVYSAEIWKANALVRSFRPVRVGTDATSWEGAMMDVLTRRIYRNAGTGAFTYGNDLKYPIPSE